MADDNQAEGRKARRILSALQLDDAAIAAHRAPEIARLRLDRPDLSAHEAADLFASACGRLGPRGWAAASMGRLVPGSDAPYPEILAWIDLVRPRLDGRLSDHADEAQASSPVPTRSWRGRGRPGWTEQLFSEHLAEALKSAEPDPSDAQLAAHFRPLSGNTGETIEPASLGRLRRRFGVKPRRGVM
jgi:hypothetical protein